MPMGGAGRGLAVLLLQGPVQAQDLARRIVVAGGDLTEIVFALGAQDQLVGVDQTSPWPPRQKCFSGSAT